MIHLSRGSPTTREVKKDVEWSSDGSVSVPAAAFLSRMSPLGQNGCPESRLPSCVRTRVESSGSCSIFFYLFLFVLLCISSVFFFYPLHGIFDPKGQVDASKILDCDGSEFSILNNVDFD